MAGLDCQGRVRIHDYCINDNPILVLSGRDRSHTVQLLLISAVDPEGDGTVVGQGHFHVSTKDATADGRVDFLRKGVAEGIIKRLRNRRRRGSEKRGSIAFFGGGVEGELADHDDVSGDVPDTQIHFPLGIFKNAQLGNFSTQPIDVGGVVEFLDAEEDEQAVLDGGDGFAIDADVGGGNALEKGSHVDGDISLGDTPSTSSVSQKAKRLELRHRRSRKR